MKRIATIFIISYVLLSCTTGQNLPLKGSYSNQPFVSYSDKSVDEVWSKIIELFATKGLTISLIDKPSGLIIGGKSSFINDYTFETSDGKLKNPNAWFVCATNTYLAVGGRVYSEPTSITGNWNIRIKPENGKTLININITNLEAGSTECKSTGVFEKMVADLIK